MRVAAHLVDAEHDRCAGKRSALFIGLIARRRTILEVEDRCTLLATNDLGANGGPLPVGGPERAFVASAHCPRPQGQNVDAAVGFARQRIAWQMKFCPPPGQVRGSGVRLDRFDDLVSQL